MAISDRKQDGSFKRSQRRRLLIIGVQHSGTTLLTAMIGRHTEVGLLNEDKGWALEKIVGKQVVGNKRCIPNQIELGKRALFGLRFFKIIGLIQEYQSSRYSIEDYLRLPNIRIIGLIRDASDVVSSIMRRSRKSFRVACSRWRRATEIIHELKTRHDEIVMVVSFEDLVVNPSANMRRVASFLGLDFEEGILEGPQHAPYYPQEGLDKNKVHRSVKEKIDFHLPEKFPSEYRKYQELLAFSRSP
jgi:hypothetical protein